MDDGPARIEELTARLALLERKTADEAAAIRAALQELRAEQPIRQPVASSTPAPTVERAVVSRAPDLSALTGPRALALVGGVVTLFGIVLVFGLAVNRGWIGPTVRCLIGAGVSTLLVGGALVIRRRFGLAASALAAAGAGIGGFYITLYAASRGYHILGNGFVWFAVVVAAAFAVTLAVSWKSELLAVLGLVAVVIAPWTVEGHLTGIGLGAALCAAAAAVAVGQQERWRLLGGLAYGLALAQLAFYVVDARRHGVYDGLAFRVDWQHRGTAGLLTCLAFGLGLAAAAAYQRRGTHLDPFAAALAGVTVPLALVSVWALFHGDGDRGVVLLVFSGAYAAVAGGCWLEPRLRELAELLLGLSLFAIALATATLLSNGGLLTAWTLEGLTLFALAARLGRRRYQTAGIAYLAIATVHLLLFETPPRHLFAELPHPAQHIAGLLLLAAAYAASAQLLRGRELVVERLDLVAAAASALAAVYAVSLGIMEAAQRLGGDDLHARFQRGETLVSTFWVLVALALLASGLTRRVKELRYGGFLLLGLALAKLFLFDLSQLSSLSRAGSFLVVGLALLTGGFLVQRFTTAGRT
ncbi:MAG: hypothetical protein QOG93_553 [Gaiellaceae bacterium]|nr:hypothetical protein [Gaiellaceae bacterium]